MSANDSFGTLSPVNLGKLSLHSLTTGASGALVAADVVSIAQGTSHTIVPGVIAALICGVSGVSAYFKNKQMKAALVPNDNDTESTLLRKTNLAMMVGSKLNSLIRKNAAVGVELIGTMGGVYLTAIDPNPVSAVILALATVAGGYLTLRTGVRAYDDSEAIRRDVRAVKSSPAHMFRPSYK